MTNRSDNLPSAIAALIFFGFGAMVVALLFLLGSHSRSEPLQPVLIATGEWPPYSGESLPRNGVASAIVASALKLMGYAPDFRFMPWERAEASAGENEMNDGVRATFPYILASPRDRDFYYSKPILDVESSVFYNRDATPAAGQIKKLGDLSAFSVVPIRGYRYPPQAERFLNSKIKPVPTNKDAFKLLLTSKEPLVVIEATSVGKSLLWQRFATNAGRIGIAPFTFKSPLYFIASKRNPNNLAFIRKFDHALAEMRASGRLEQIRKSVLAAIDAQHKVELQPVFQGAPIRAFLDPSQKRFVYLPRGTSAVVEHWSDEYLTTHTAGQQQAKTSGPYGLVQVRVINGPLSGNTYLVDSRSIQLP